MMVSTFLGLEMTAGLWEDNEFRISKYDGQPVKLQGNEEYVLASSKKSGKFEYVSTLPR